MNAAANPFSGVLEALGAIDTDPVDRASHWAFYRVRYPTPAGFQVASYLTLSRDCPLSEASAKNLAHWKSLSGSVGYSVIAQKNSRHAQDLEKSASVFRGRTATTSRDLLFENVVSSFMPAGEAVVPDQYFIEPDIKLPDGSSRPALSYIVDDLLGRNNHVGSTSADVLVAPAGLGKTTVARQIAKRILESKSKAIPILVESAQWQNLINLTLSNVFNAALLQVVPEGVRLTNPKIFPLLVREQLLVPIFDGFDELCLHPQSNYTPTNLLNDLLDLVGDAGARLLITTRETFWQTYGVTLSRRIDRLDLQGFSNDQRQRFFSKRLARPDERDIANRLAREIGERLYEAAIQRRPNQADRASGVPLLLELVALYVADNPLATFAPASQDPLGPLLEAVCEREDLRQQLNITAEKQMRIFEELFLDFPEDIGRGDLTFYVQDVAPDATKDALTRFESHAFFAPGRDVRPRFESLRVYFMARWLVNQLEGNIGSINLVPRVAKLLERNAAGNTDVFDFLVDRFEGMDVRKSTAVISHAWRMIQASMRPGGALSALFHLGQRLAHAAEQSRRARTEYLITLLGLGMPIRRLSLIGQVSGLDLSGLTFRESSFRDVEFQNCAFSETTVFEQSRFDGTLVFVNCTNPGRARLAECSLSESAEDEWNTQAGRASRRLINEAVVREGLREILRKFLGPFGFSSIKNADRNTGPIARNPCREEVWEGLFSEKVLEHHRISGVSEGGINVSESSDVRHEVRNFIDNAAMGGRLRRVLEGVLKARAS